MEWKSRTAKIRFVRRYCVDEAARRAEEKGIRVAKAVLDIAEEWHTKGRRPITDREGEEKGGKKLSGLKTGTESESR